MADLPALLSCYPKSVKVSYTPFTRSSKRRANIKQAWWNPAPWLKCRPRLSPLQLITCYIQLQPAGPPNYHSSSS